MDTGGLRPWDGIRERLPRVVLDDERVKLRGMTFGFVSEHVNNPTDWCFNESDHIFVLHRGGRLRSMEMSFDDGPSSTLLPEIGHVWLIPAQHRYSALAQGSTVSFTEIRVPTAVLGSPPVAPLIGARDPFLFQACARLRSVADRSDVSARLFSEALVETIALHMRDHYGAPQARAGERVRDLDSATRNLLLDIVESELDSELSLGRLAELADMSVVAFIRAFTAEFGTTPHQFVLDRRMDAAKKLLESTSTPITDVSAAVGFATPSHFATTFKRRVGMTPTQYRTTQHR